MALAILVAPLTPISGVVSLAGGRSAAALYPQTALRNPGRRGADYRET